MLELLSPRFSLKLIPDVLPTSQIGLGDISASGPSVSAPAPSSLQSEATGVGTLLRN